MPTNDSPAHAELRLEEGDTFLYPAFHSAEAFYPKSGFRLYAHWIESRPG